MPKEEKHRHVRVRGHQREQLDADLVAQLVIMMGRQLARLARGEVLDNQETLPAQKPRNRADAKAAEQAE